NFLHIFNTLCALLFSPALPTLEYDNRLKGAQTVKAGSTLTLRVNVSGIPVPTVSWLLEGQVLEKTDRVSIETSKDFSTITVKNATVKDSGIYTINAENVVGKAAADFEVNVKDKPAPPENLKALEILKNSIALAWEPPLNIGGSAITGYVVEKREANKNTWMPVTTTDGTTTAFSAQKLLEGKEYFFRVSAQNDVGTGEPTELKEGIVAKSPFDAPEAPKKLTATEITKSSMTLTWEPPESDGGSPITGYALERKSPTSSRWVRVNKSPIRDTVYTVTDLTEGDQYEFRVLAENAAGFRSPSAITERLLAKDPYDKPEAPKRPEPVDITSSSVTLKWLPPPSDGGNAIFNYVVEYRPTSASRWKSANPASAAAPDTSFTVTTLEDGTVYEFRVAAENKAGVGPFSQPSEPVTAANPVVGEAPTVLEGLPDVAVTEGETVLLGCKISGEPAPTIKWLKDGREIAQDKRREMVYQDFVASLAVKDVQSKDAGSYTCQASNDLGTVNTSGVLEIQAAPTLDFDNKFKDLITLHAGAMLKIPVRVGGIPAPNISWKQENKTLRSGGKVTMDIQETSTCLTVKNVSKEDDGLYTLQAQNEVGEASAKFDVEILDKPSAPEGPIAVSSLTKDSATLTWKPPKDDGGSDVIAYVVERRDAKRNVWTKVMTLDAVTLDYKATGLVVGNSYYFRITAENEVGQSEPLETSAAVTPKSPFDKPSAPEGPIEFSQLKADSVTLTWKPPASDGGCPILHYIVERKDARKTSWTKVTTVDAKSPLSCVAHKLLEDVPYMFRVSAVNEEGQGPPLEADKEVVPKAPADVPGKPTGPIKFSQILADSVTLAWSPPKKDGGSVVTSYTIEQSRDNGRSWEQTGSVEAKTTILTAKDLKEGQKYKFRVCANNDVGAGLPLESDSVTPQRQITKPSEPTGPLTVEDVRKDSVLLSWKPPADDGGSPLTGYVIMKRDEKRPTWSPAGKCDATTTAFKVKDLLEGTEYFFKVVAENKAGQSDGLETDASTLVKSPYDKPSAPEGPIEFSELKADSVTLTWKPPASDGGCPIQNYIVERKDTRKTNWTKVTTVDAKSPLSCVAHKLLEDVPYMFRVSAVNEEGQGPPLEADMEIVPKAPADVPGKPSGPIKFSQILADSVTLAWSPPKKDGGSVVTSYTIEQSRDNGRSWEQTGTVEAKTTILTAKDLKEGQKYKFRVCANNDVGAGLPLESDSVTPQREITKPGEPTGPLTVEDVRKDSVLLSWKPSADDGGSPLTGYIIMKRDGKRPTWSPAGKCDATTTAFKVKDLLEGTEYFFKVVAENKAGQSDGLETDTSTLVKSAYDKPSAPEGPIEFTELKADSVTLTWKPPASDGGCPIQNYIVERKDARKTSWTKVTTVDAKFQLNCVAHKLLEDVPYMFRVSAVNEEGQGPPLEADKEVVPKAPADVPGKPTGPIKFSQILADSVTLAWSPPKKDGGSVVTSYTIEQSRDNGRSWEKTGTVEAKTTILTAKDLKEGQKYKFRVCANNDVGAGLPLESDIVTPQRKISKPSEPNGPFAVKDVTKDSVTLTWKPPTDDGGSPLTGYIVLKRDHKRSTWSPAGKCDGSTNELKVKELTEGIQYFFKVVAENKAGQSEGLETETATLVKSLFDKPSQPVGPLEISNVTDSTADLSWKPPKSDGGSPVTSYIIESRPTNRSTWNQSGKVKGDQTSFTVPDLRLDMEYIFRVIAVNAEGQSSPLESKETARPKKKINPPGPPQNVRAGRIGADYVTLEWKPPAKDGGAKVTAYKVEKCEEIDGEWVKVTEVKAIDTSYKVEHLKENVGYYFSVSAKNEAGFSEPCEADALIKPKKPEGKPSTPVGPMEISDLDKTTVTLTWQPPKSDGGSPLTAYVVERREAARSQWTKMDSTLPADTTLTTRNLIEGNEYYFRVCAENKHGRSDWLETDQSVKMRSPFEKPGRPTGPMELSDLTRNSVKLAWKPPESDGGTPITKYIIESRPSARSNWTAIGDVKGDTLTFSPEDLQEGTEYHFRVMAVNKEGQGPALEAKETVTPERKIDPPSQPTGLKVVKVGTDFVTLDWKAPLENGGSKITGYKVEMSEAGSDKWVNVADVDSYDTGYKVTGLKPDKNYLFRVAAKNAAGYGEACQIDKEVKPKTPEGKPEAPQGPLQVRDVEKTSVTLSWKAPTSDGGSPLTGYVIEKKEVTRPTWTRVEKISPEQTKFIVENLLEGSDYQFRVTAENKHGSSSPLVTDAYVKPKSKFDKPSKPLGPLEFSDIKESSVTLSWKPPSSDGGKPIEKYIIEQRDLRRSTWVKAGSVPGDSTTFTADNLSEGNSYMFRVTAINEEGESQPLESVDTVKPMRPATTPGTPSNLKVQEVGKDHVKIQWSPPKQDGGSKITGYTLFTRLEGSDEWKEAGNVGPLDTDFTFKDLSDKKKYFFAVVAENKQGKGDRLETESSVKPKKPATKPSPPVGPIKFSDITRSSVTLSWRPSEDDGGDMISGYILERKEAWKTVWSPVGEVSPDITSYCVQKLREGQEYIFRVMAENSIGRSTPLESDSVTPKHPFSSPSAPEGPLETSNLTASAVDLTWKPPKSDGGQPLTCYKIERRDTKRSTWTPLDKVKPNVTTYTAQDLSTEVDYYFRVIAENSEGSSPALETLAFVRPVKELHAPSQPKGPMKLSDFTEISVTMHWQHPSDDGGSDVLQYILEIQEDKHDWKQLSTVDNFITKFKAADLKEGTMYKFRVSAVNKVGQSKPLESDQVVLEKPPEKPGPPTYPFTMTEFSKTSLTLTWGPSQTDGGSSILHYILEKRESWKSTFQYVTKVKPQSQGQKLTHCVEGLKEDQDYMFRVFAENSVGASKAIETDVPYKPRSPFTAPSVPTGPIRFEDIKETSLTLDWLPPKQDGGSSITGYTVQVSTDGADFKHVGTTESQITKFKAKDLQTGSKHVFRIVAENKVGQSKPLESDTVVPQRKATKPSKPKGPIVVKDVNRSSCTIQWSPPEDDGGAPLKNYLVEKREATRTSWSRADKISPEITTHCIQSLNEGAEFYFRVIAENKVGPSEPLEMDKAVKIKSPYDKPSAPEGPLKVSEVGEKSAMLSWQPPRSDGGLPISGYTLQFKESRRSTWMTFKEVSAEETSVTLTGLVPDTEYVAQVMAVNKEGSSPGLLSEPIRPKRVLAVPSAPKSIHIRNMGKDNLTLEWSAPESDGGSRIKKYLVEKTKMGSDKWTKVSTVDSYKTFQAVSDLEQEVEWLFAVSAINEVGQSERAVTSKPVKLDKPIEPPSAPIGPMEFSNITKKGGRVSWKPSSSDGGSPITHYSVEKRETWKSTWVPVERVPSNKTSCDLVHLTEGQEIFLRVMAENVAGQSKPLEGESPLVPKSPYNKPSAPEDLKATNVTSSTASLQWRAPSDTGGLPITSYIVERRDKRWGSWVKAGTTKSGVTILDVASLLEGAEYYFRVSAINEEGQGPWTEMSQAVMPVKEPVAPDRPLGPVRFSSVLATSLTLDWQPPREDGGSPITAYKVEVSSKQEVWTEVTITDANVTKVNVKDLKEGQKVWFRVTAFNKIGASKPLDSDSIVPQREKTAPSMPTQPMEAKVESRDTVSVTWGPPQDDGGSPITGYILEKREALRMSWSRAEKIAGPVTKATVRNLVEGSDFLFRVAAVNKEGTSEFLEMDRPIKVKSLFSVPSAPQGPLKVSDITKDSCVLEWQPPKSDGGQPLLNYSIEIRESRRSMWAIAGTCKPDKTNYTAKNLVVNNEYYFRIKAVNAEGESEPLEGSESVLPKIKQDLPGKPAMVKLPKSPAGTLTVEWQAPSKDGGARIKQYLVQIPRLPTGLTWPAPMPSPPSSPYLTWTVTRSTSSVWPPSMQWAKETTQKPRCQARPPRHSVSHCGHFACLVKLSLSLLIRFITPRANSTVSASARRTSLDVASLWKLMERSCLPDLLVQNLLEGVEYKFRVLAENKVGVSEPLETEATVKPICPYGPPTVPIGPIKTSKITRDSVTLQWQRPTSDGGSPITGYLVERREGSKRAWMYCGRTDADTMTLTCTALYENNEYYFRVYAENKYGRSKPLDSDIAVVPKRIFDKPSAPERFRAEKIDKDSLTLVWSPPEDDDGSISRYIVEQKHPEDDAWAKTAEVPGKTKWVMVKKLQPGQSYLFRVIAENPAGRSEPTELSSPVTLKIKKEKPKAVQEAPQVEELGKDFVYLTWSPPESDGGSPVTGYVLERMDISGKSWLPVTSQPIKDTAYRVTQLRENVTYEFRVRAQNAVGVSEPSPASEPFMCGHKLAREPPKFIADFGDLSVPVGQDAKFTCQVVGLPTPEVSWYRNYREVFEGRKCTIRHENTNMTLIVKNVDFSDQGEVECQARNKYGAVSIRATLNILAAPQVDFPDSYGKGLRFCRGDTIKVRVPISGTPTPRTTWSRGREIIDVGSRRGRADITGTNLHTTMIIEDCVKADEGNYTLLVENKLGSISVDVPICVVEPPDSPDKPIIQEVDKHSVQISWNAPEYDGGSPIVGYVVERRDPITGIWRWALSTSDAFCTVACLEEHGEHRFRVMAENRFGVSEPSKESEIVVTKEALPAIDYDGLYDDKFLGSEIDVNRIKGDVLGKYIICEELGRGAFGVVYRAVERATGKNWAAKFIHCRPQDKDNIRHEIDVMNSLHHPKLLQLHEAFDQRGEMVMILELLSGGELFDRLVEEDYTLTEADCVTYMRQICQGVQHMHHNNILHLDLKPENVMCVTRETNDIKIIDFGLAQRLEEGRQVKVLFGTAEFCAPEIVNYEPVSFSTDMWSVGVLSYVLLSGYSPFAGDDNHQTFQFVNLADYDFDDEAWERVSADAKDFIQRLLIKDKKQRMTIDEALEHPWLNPRSRASADLDLTDGSTQRPGQSKPLSTAGHKHYRDRTKRKEDALDVLPIGRLSRDSADMRKEGGQGIVMRKLVMEMPEHAPSFIEELSPITGLEGSKTMLSCKFAGKPSPKITWLKNGEPLVEDANHKTNVQEGEATLQIHVLSTADEGTYTCQANNAHGEAETSAQLTVEEVRHRRKRMEDEEASLRFIRPLNQYDTSVKDTNIAPEFTLPLVDQSRAVGEEVTFTVTVTCRPEPDVTWYHGDQEVVRSSQVSFQHDKGVYRMTIIDLNVKDAGQWRCKAVNSYGEAWCSCDLKVLDQVPPSHSRPRFTKELEYMTVTQGSLVRLECSVVGEPAPEIKWFKDRVRVDVSDRHYKIRHSVEGKVTSTTLVIEGSEVEDGGMYMCVAENSAGSASSEAKMRVQKVYDYGPDRDSMEPLEKRTRDGSPVRKSRVDVPPDFTAKLKSKSAAEGATVRLNCSVTGIPEPMVRWFRDGKEIFDGHDYTMRNNYGLLSLEIVYAKKALAGKYTVEASNSLGTVSTSCTLDVEGDEELDALEADFLRPKFLTKIQDIHVNEGADATFQCDATGKPMPAFKWQRDNITIVGSRRILSEYDNQGHATLTLKEVKVTDAGLYYCIAQSRAGRSKCSAYLHVKAKSPSPTHEPPAYRRAGGQQSRSSRERSEARGAPPSFALTLPSSMDVAVGERLKLDCSVQGFPIPLVTWHKGDRELMYSQRHRIILCGTLHTMEIPQAMALDKGHYIVRATNIHGTVESSCFVNTLAAGEKVRSPPDYRRDAMRDAARGNLQVETSSEEDEPEPPRKQAKAPFFIKHLPKTIDVMEGIDVRLDCILRRGIELVRWSSSRSPSQERDKERQLKKELKDEGFSGEFIPLEAKAASGRSSVDERTAEPDGRREHPSFVTTPTDLVRPVGSDAVFECSTAGIPEPEVKWLKDGRVLISSDGVRMTSSGNKHKLRLKAILQSDAGQYSCTATSSAGSDSCTARLTIADDSSPRRPSTAQAVEEEETEATKARAAESKPKAGFEVPEKAVFSQGLPKTMTAGQGEEVELLCQLSSSAEVAGVRWELDGRQLPPEARYVVSHDEDTHDQRLTVQGASPQDSGKYTCVVTFKDGDLIHTSTWLTVNAKEPTPPAKEEDFMPHFTSELSNVSLKDGDELVLECDIQGNPRPQISWIRDGVEIFDSQDFQISMIGDHCKLQIADIYPEDEGKYSCRAVNVLGEATTSCFVTVEALA
ncbi:hypothetical protein EGW08_001882, partial [Elysia chlorotica]